MKAITAQQPVPALWLAGVARWVTVPGEPDVSSGDRIALHADDVPPSFDDMRLVADNPDAWNAWCNAGLVLRGGAMKSGPLGAIVGSATVGRILPIVEDDGSLDRWAVELLEVEACEPVPMAGHGPGFWEVTW